VRAVAAAAGLLLALSSTGTVDFSLRPRSETELAVTLSGPESELAAGPFQGSIAINGSPAAMPIRGTVAHSAGKWVLPVTVRFADVPADWADRFQPDSFVYRLKGGVGTAVREWEGRRAWKDVAVEGDRETLAGFLALDRVALTSMSLMSSEAEAEVTLRNPFAFDLRIAATQYTLSANDSAVGSGETRGMILHAGKQNRLGLPIEIDHAELVSAAGGALLSGGDVAVRLDGRIVIRLRGGDVTLPLRLSGRLAGAS
jgi:LEA14-like dessication related protein